jgi:hypothetical protein
MSKKKTNRDSSSQNIEEIFQRNATCRVHRKLLKESILGVTILSLATGQTLPRTSYFGFLTYYEDENSSYPPMFP